MNDFLFIALTIVAALGAISVVVCRNVAHMAASLIVALSSVAGLFFALNANFVGATQLMVYVGGTVILLIFGVMLTSMAAKADLKTTPFELIVGLAMAAVLLLIFNFTIGSITWADHFGALAGTGNASAPLATQSASSFPTIALALAGIRADNANAHSYLLPFEIVSVHLMVVLVAAGYLARPRETQEESEMST